MHGPVYKRQACQARQVTKGICVAPPIQFYEILYADL